MMLSLLYFRVVLVVIFMLAAWRLSDWKNWQRYYPTILFVMVVNLSAGYLSYHHGLWNYSKDFLVTTETIVEFVNTYINLPSAVLIYLSLFPPQGVLRQIAYLFLWVAIFGTLEFFDHYVFTGIFYTNGWSWGHSVIFDIAMFSIIRVHFINPWKGWVLSLLVAAFIISQFGFLAAEMK